jgi:hypothetical protein
MTKPLLFISQDKEMALIQEMTYKIKRANLDIHPSNTCFLCVSPDYSGIVTQHLSHSLTMDGEIFHIEAVNVPFPDENNQKYRVDFEVNFADWVLDWEKFVLIEAGVIRGSNYTWITESMEKFIDKNYYTVALCENTRSKFKSDFTSLQYDAEMWDLHFWWEQPNNHWQ